MRRLAAFAVAVAALLVDVRSAHACSNAVLADDDDHAKLRKADQAVEEGDVGRARALASGTSSRSDLSFYMRAQRVIAMSWIRDPAASPHDIEQAIEHLQKYGREDPRHSAELAEAWVRGETNETAAYEALAPLADKDLIGTPWAYAALARVATKRGETAMATLATKRCSEIASPTTEVVCRGQYPAPSAAMTVLPPAAYGAIFGLVAFASVLAVVMFVGPKRKKRQPA